MTTALLAIEDLHAAYGLSRVPFGISSRDAAGAVCLLGRNGVGKTTTIRSVMASYDRPAEGCYGRAPTSPVGRRTGRRAPASALSRRPTDFR
jgi:ABC-type histidine transport system ATPase subunit